MRLPIKTGSQQGRADAGLGLNLSMTLSLKKKGYILAHTKQSKRCSKRDINRLHLQIDTSEEKHPGLQV